MNVTIYPNTSSPAAGINFDEASVVKNIAGATLSYSDTGDPFIAEGTLAVGATVELHGSYFFRASETTLLSHVPLLTGTTDERMEELALRFDNAIPSVLDRGVDNVGLVDQATAIAALAPGSYILPRDGFMRLATEAVVPAGVNFIGQDPGYDDDDWPTGSIFRCTTASGRLTFADGSGGLSSNFMVDGAGVATNAMKLEVCANRTFTGILVRDSTGDNLVLNGSQNNTFHRLQSLSAGAACVVLDNAAGSNYFHDSELYYPGTYHIVSRQSLAGGNPEIGGLDYPLNNVFDGGIAEYATATTQGCVYQSAGNHLRFTGGFNFAPGNATAVAGPAVFRLENQSPAMSTNGNIIVEGTIAVPGSEWTYLDVISGTADYALHVVGYNYAGDLAIGIKYASGITSLAVDMQGSLDFVATGDAYVHGSAVPEYGLLFGRRLHGINYDMPAADDPTVRLKVQGDAADRVQIRPDGVWFGPGNAAVDAGIARSGVASVAVSSILSYSGAVATAAAPAYSTFIDSADLLLKHKRFDGTVARASYIQAAANADTSGAALADLEAEVNQLKAALRTAGVMAT